MYEHGPKKHSPDRPAGNAAPASEAERRNTDRHSFTASAEVVELSSGARFATRTTDLGPGGCFVDTMVPFPVGAKVHISVRKGKTLFQTGGIVMYSQAGLGMGIAFDNMEPQQRQSLDTWLEELNGGRHAQTAQDARRVTAPARRSSDRGSESSATLVRLIQLMIGKGILTAAEGASVLHDPLL